MEKDSKLFVAGASGMVGSAIIRKLISIGHENIVGSYHSRRPEPEYLQFNQNAPMMPRQVRLLELDLTRQEKVERFFESEMPDYVFLAAARVGGIYANNTYPAQFIYENLSIQNNVIHSAYSAGVQRFLFLGSSCIYPQLAPQPMQEAYLLSGFLEPTNEPYAVAKIAGIKMCESYNRQYHTRFAAIMPTNLYGPNDDFDLENSHVLPALLRKFHDAKMRGQKKVEIWGTGKPRREFLHVDDMADASVFVMNLDESTFCEHLLSYPKPCFLNVGSGVDCTILKLAETIKAVVGYEGEIGFDASKPDGAPQKLLDVSRLSRIGWKSKINLEEGIFDAYKWYLKYLDR